MRALVELEQPGEEFTARRSPLSCEVFRDFRGLEQLQANWDEVVVRTCRSIYMTYDWLRIWWDCYGGAADLRVFVFSADGAIVATVPIYIETLGWGPLRLRVARLVGANIPPKVFSPPVPHCCAAEVFAAVLAHLFGQNQCDVLSFGPVSETDAANQALLAASEQRGDVHDVSTAASGAHSVYHLPADLETYFGTMLRKSERKNRRKLELRLLEKEYPTRVEVITDAARAAVAFEEFAEQHTEVWRKEGRGGHFGAWPRARDFHRALVLAQARRGRLRFIRIIVNDEVIASEYAFAIGDRYFAELTSRSADPKWERFSLGPSSTVTMLAQGIKEGMQRVESGLGRYDYKVRLGATEHAALTFRIVASSWWSRARLALFSFVRRCVNVGYHKIWYRRVVPRLPSFVPRSQWPFWLRLDF